MASIFEDLMLQNHSVVEDVDTSAEMLTESLEPSVPSNPEVKKFNVSKFKVESRRVFESESFDELDKQFAADPETEDEGEIVLVIDPEINAEDDLPEDAAEKAVGSYVYKCPVCGSNYLCNCDAELEEAVEVDDNGVPTECPICGDDADQILIGEIAPVETAGEEVKDIDPVDPEDAEEEDSEEQTAEEEESTEEEPASEEEIVEEGLFGKKKGSYVVFKQHSKDKGIEILKEYDTEEGAEAEAKRMNSLPNLTKGTYVFRSGEKKAVEKLRDNPSKELESLNELFGFGKKKDKKGSAPEKNAKASNYGKGYRIWWDSKSNDFVSVAGKDPKPWVSMSDEERDNGRSNDDRYRLLQYDDMVDNGHIKESVDTLSEDESLNEFFDIKPDLNLNVDARGQSVGIAGGTGGAVHNPLGEDIDEDELEFDETRFESLVNKHLDSTFKNAPKMKVESIKIKGSNLIIEYKMSLGNKTSNGTLHCEGFDVNKKIQRIVLKDKGVITESVGRQSKFEARAMIRNGKLFIF